MRVSPLVVVAVMAWLAAGVWGGRAIVAGSHASTADIGAAADPAPTDVVTIVGLAEQAAIAWARGDDTGTAQLRALPHRDAVAPVARDGAHYVDRAAVVDLDGASDDWLVLVRVDALRVTPDGYQPVGPVLVSVPITARHGGWLLAGQPLERPVDTASTDTAG